MLQSIAERLRNLFAPTEELEASQLRTQAQQCGAQQLTQCQPRARVTLRGTVTAITADTKRSRLEAELSDGSGTVRLIWLGRNQISCVLPGRTLRVSGRLASEHDQLVIYNPHYEVLASPPLS